MTNKNKYILALDLGTSGPKVALVSVYGEVIASEIEETQLILSPGGGAKQDPGDWWQAIKRASRKLLNQKLVPIEDIVAVSCTSQWSGTVAVDKSGKHLMNAIIWMDSRGAEYVRQITGGLITIEGYGAGRLLTWVRLTGGIPTRSGKDSIAHILYIRAKHPKIYRNTYKFLEPKDYLNLRLTGKFAASHDSIALHWVTDNRDINNIAYSDKLLKMATLEREKLPDLKRAVDVLGTVTPGVAAELGLSEKTQVVMGTPDIHSAAIGSGAVKDYQAHLYIGTSSWLLCHVPFKKTDLFHNMASLPSAIPGKYLLINEQETAGASLKFLKDNVLYHQDELLQEENLPDVYKIFDRIAARIPAGSGKVIFAPWLNGERSPVDDHTVRGGLYNLSLQTTREHLVRAVFEGVAFNSRWLMMYVEKFIKRKLEAINMIGGGANSDVWCQIHADILNRDIRQMQDPIQANARGAAFLASAALGYLTFDEIGERAQVAKTYHPNSANRQIYDELFNAFLNIYNTNKKIYNKLNRG
ncbi:MAG: xylulose kinase [Desulfosarcina sp.]|nr:xylulose kinase [Desulfosarcina sp.]MBC2741639.1 xylulose kinase [Desulfosarcina sp.]MBC2764553.1 xylulose kinase [Desulfosarcina sp.]